MFYLRTKIFMKNKIIDKKNHKKFHWEGGGGGLPEAFFPGIFFLTVDILGKNLIQTKKVMK